MRSIEISNDVDLNAAGSRTGGLISSQSSELDSPGIHSTVHSWDSHANYHGNYGHGDRRHGSSANAVPWPRASNLIFYCDIQGHLKTATGLVRLLLLVSVLNIYLILHGQQYMITYAFIYIVFLRLLDSPLTSLTPLFDLTISLIRKVHPSPQCLFKVVFY